MKRRVIILVIDGMGAGAMSDVPATRPADTGAHTLRRIAQLTGPLILPALERLGLGNATAVPGVAPVGGSALGAWGLNQLAHLGADTYMGHQELMGTRPVPPVTQLMTTVAPAVRQELIRAGFAVEPVPGTPVLLVEGAALVADNIDGEPGGNINVTGSLDLLPFDTLVAMGRAVRQAVRVNRVIVCANDGYGLDAMLDHLVQTPRGQIGVDTPALGLYREGYQVRHLGVGVDTDRQLPGIARRAGLPVCLIGKAADVIECPGAELHADVPTAAVFDRLDQALDGPSRLLVANVQETDLAGHAEDATAWRAHLTQSDRRIGSVLRALGPDDLLMITGDHGNDPGIGHKQHTREQTPLLVYGQRLTPCNLGIRSTLSDVAATGAEWLGLPPPQNGTSFRAALAGT